METLNNVPLGNGHWPKVKRLLFSCALCCVSAAAVAQGPQITLRVSNQTVKEALEALKQESGYSLWFNSSDVDLTRRVSFQAKDKTVEQVLALILQGQSVHYTVKDKHIQITEQDVLSADRMVIKGQVLDKKDGFPLMGCMVRVKGKKVATVTDKDGYYEINAGKKDILVFSYMGYNTLELRADNRHLARVFMEDDVVLMKDVVVTGYQTLKKFNVTGSVSTIDSEEISLRSSVGLEGVLEGAVPGLTVYNDQYRIRGGASMNSGNDPLFIVDDFEVEELPENMDMVESITVLKDAAATAIWGSRAANGVVVITTKKGKSGDFKISYSNNFKVSAKPDFDDLNRASSEQIVDFDREVFMAGYDAMMGGFGWNGSGYSLSQGILNDYIPPYGEPVDPSIIPEMDARLKALASQSNRKQIEDYLLRNAFKQQHFLSVSGGTEKFNYFLSGSFIGGHSEYVGDKTRSANINSRASYKILPELTLRSDISATFDNNDNGYAALSSDIYSLYPFQMLVDEQGNRVADYTQFSKIDADRLTNDYGYLGFGKNLLDEVDYANNHTTNIDYKVRLGLDYKIINGLSLSADYQYERYNSTNKDLMSEDSYAVRELINTHTVISDEGLTYRIPKGDILDHYQSDVNAWIFKVGANLNRSFGAENQHYVNAVAGFEMRHRHHVTESYRKLGYDDQLLTWTAIDAVDLAKNPTETGWGTQMTYDAASYDRFGDLLNREISYFLSGVYTYDNRYTASASMRVDESNLFGVSDKYRRNPIWAVGANWNVKNESFFNCDAVSALLLRTSIGLTGNFDRSGSTTPVMVGKFISSSLVDGGGYMRIVTPPNPLLRWERTRSFNVSADLGLFDRVNTTLTYYQNKSYDLLGEKQLDPTVGYTNQRINAADMSNKGVELELHADLIRLKDFTWNLGFIYGYNKNKITRNDIYDSDPVINRTMGTTKFVEGYAREGLWSYRWAGLNEEGMPQVYKADGTKVTDPSEVEVEDLEFSGTYQPKHSGSITTGFRYKNFQANFLFTYNFGHVFRIEYPDMNPFASSPAMNKMIGDRWRKPGDEAKTDIPAILPDVDAFWDYYDGLDKFTKYSSNSIRKGDMIRLREILLNYELPKKWLQNTPVRRLSVTAQLNNICLWTANKEGYDPEAISPVSGTYSLTEPLSFTCGLKVDF